MISSICSGSNLYYFIQVNIFLHFHTGIVLALRLVTIQMVYACQPLYGSIFSLLISLLDRSSNEPDKAPAKIQSDRTTISSGINPMKER